jgi:hypothetical protein
MNHIVLRLPARGVEKTNCITSRENPTGSHRKLASQKKKEKSYIDVFTVGWYGFKRVQKGRALMQSQLVTMMISSILGSLFLLKVSTEFGNRTQVNIGTTRDAKGSLYVHQRREEWTDEENIAPRHCPCLTTIKRRVASLSFSSSTSPILV